MTLSPLTWQQRRDKRSPEITTKDETSMRKLLQSLSLVALTALPAFAQETTAPATEDLSMGASAAPAVLTKDTAQVGQGYLATTFELWEQRCEKTEDGKDPCQLFQLLKDADGNAVAEFSIFALPAGGKAAAGGTIVAPLETLLTEHLTIAIDTAPAKLYPFTFCTVQGCVARVGFTAEEVEQFKKGAKATVSLVPAAAPDKRVTLDISLKGFTAGYEAVAATIPAP
jgi:invasion protein IalB